MYSGSNGTPGHTQDFVDRSPEDEVEKRIAQFAFVREERDREVRLLFRDVSAPDLALSFRAAGASLISISAERISNPEPDDPAPRAEQAPNGTRELAASEQAEARSGGRKRRRQPLPPPPSGELLLRYFFSLGETVYTVNLASPTGVVGSVAGIYPLARMAEEELHHRLNVIFT